YYTVVQTCKPFFLYITPPDTLFYPLSLHDALPISVVLRCGAAAGRAARGSRVPPDARHVRDRRDRDHDARRRPGARDDREREHRSEEHTSELQSPYDLVCRLLLEKKKQLRVQMRTL